MWAGSFANFHINCPLSFFYFGQNFDIDKLLRLPTVDFHETSLNPPELLHADRQTGRRDEGNSRNFCNYSLRRRSPDAGI
jgi:hypothetical protein